MQRITTHLPGVFAVFLATGWPSSAFSFEHSLHQGTLEQGIYVSATQKIRCDLIDYVTSSGFFIDESYDFGESETLVFGKDPGSHVDIWVVRRQKIDRLEFMPGEKEGFPVNEKTFIPYFYSEYPYAIKSISKETGISGSEETLYVEFEGLSQVHAYWLASEQGWLSSIQFIPSLVEEDKMLSRHEAERLLDEMKERCQFVN